MEMHSVPQPSDTDDAIEVVSEDGFAWAPYDPGRDYALPLHRRIVFVRPADE